jgi:RHS repeat-associated protein
LQVYLPGDPDGQPSEWYEYYTLANGATVNTQRVVKHVKDGTAEGLVAASFYDGLGRTWRVARRVGADTWSATDTAYDSMGHVGWVSNPYLTGDLFGRLNPSGVWTATEYDGLGRVTAVATPDGARVTTVIRDGAATVTDQAGRQRKLTYDVLGRLVQVVEDPGGLGYVTGYQYDALGNLRQVTQGDQQRFFLYDGLSRLIRVRDVEQEENPGLALSDPFTPNSRWSRGYEYDATGNLLKKVDPRGIETNYQYDALNRVTSVSYSDGSTHTVSQSYDGAVNGKGRPWVAMTFDPKNRGMMAAKATIDSYDAMGRVLSQSQVFSSGRTRMAGYRVQQKYNLAGQVEEKVYPSGRKVRFSYDQGGNLTGVAGSLGDGQSRVYADEMRYNAAGQKIRERLGTQIPLYHNRHYNNRHQPYDVRLGTEAGDEWSWNRGALRTFYDGNYANGDGGFVNNGSVYRMDHLVPLEEGAQNWAMSTAWYGYDPLNRVLGIWETKTSSADPSAYPLMFAQLYKYDRYGNRTLDGEKTSQDTPINRTVFTVNERTNRFAELEYDKAGNVTRDGITGMGQRVYDAGNRIVAAEGTGGWSYYGYDGLGRRVSRTENGQTWWYVHGIGGELLAEYKAGTDPAAPEKENGHQGRELVVVAGKEGVRWLVKDHLGTPRMVVDQTGSLTGVSRHDYLPFGEEIGAGVGIREAAAGYGSDGVRQKFTGKERDAETHLDWFGPGRYYGSLQGRFVSPDPLNIPALMRVDPKRFTAVIADPANWNGYAYAHNNPLSKLDPDGFLTIIIPGTFNDFNAWNTSEFKKWVSKTFGENAIVFKWSGEDNWKNRSQAAKELNAYIEKYMKDHPGEKINLVAHSHGGNVVFEASRTTKHRFDTVVTLGTPIRDDYKPNHPMISYHLNVYSKHDKVQISGGYNFVALGVAYSSPALSPLAGLGSAYGQFGSAGRTINHPMVYNRDASEWANSGPLDSHSDLWMKSDTWLNVVEPNLKK